MVTTNHIRHMKKHDTGEPVRVAIVNKSNDTAQDLTGATVLFLMYKVDDDTGLNTQVISSAATIESPETDGYITYEWQTGDTDEVGNFLALFEVTYASGVIESYPRHGYIEIRIEDDLNDT